MTVLAKCEIAVHAKKAIALFGEIVSNEPRIEGRPGFVLPVNSPASIDVIYCQKLKSRLATARTLTSIGSDDQFLISALSAFCVSCYALSVSGRPFLHTFSYLFFVGACVLFVLARVCGITQPAPFSSFFAVFSHIPLPFSGSSLRVSFSAFFFVLLCSFRVSFFPTADSGYLLFSMGFVVLLSGTASRVFSRFAIAVFVRHWTGILTASAIFSKEKIYVKRNRDWRCDAARATCKHRQPVVLGGSAQRCVDEKFSLIDLDAEMQTGRKGSDAHRERLSERTSLVDGAIVWSFGNLNRKRTAEMTVPCFA